MVLEEKQDRADAVKRAKDSGQSAEDLQLERVQGLVRNFLDATASFIRGSRRALALTVTTQVRQDQKTS